MFFSKRPEYKAVVARGFNGIEQITIEVSAASADELRTKVEEAAGYVVQGRIDYYDQKQLEFEALTRQKLEDAVAEDEAAIEADKKKGSK